MTPMRGRGSRVVWLALITGLVAPSALTAGSWISPQDTGQTPADVRISFTALNPAVVQAPSRQSAKLLSERKEAHRSYPRPWAVFASLIPIATLLLWAFLRLPHGKRSRLASAGRGILSRAPPALTFP